MMERSSIEQKRLRDVEENLKEIRENMARAALRSGRRPEEVTLMAVTKTVEPLYINHAIGCGIDLIGENRVQEYLGKREELRLEHCQKHLIGHLQTNKVRQIVGQVDCIQSVDSMKIAREISKCSEKLGIVTPVLLEVNIGREESKTGMDPDLLEEIALQAAALPGISVRGLMAIPPVCQRETELRGFFSNMYESFVDIGAKKLDNIHMDILSMGMSGDYQAAIEEGATLVRVGSALFGARVY